MCQSLQEDVWSLIYPSVSLYSVYVVQSGCGVDVGAVEVGDI